MPDIGSVAAILQLVEQGLQVTRVCYTFLHDIKNAPEDIMVAVEEFNSIVDLFSNLQIHIEELKSAAIARGGQLAIPVSVAQAAKRLHDLVLQFRALLQDDGDKVPLYRRVTWVLDAKRRGKLLRSLDRERCKLQGALLLSIEYVVYDPRQLCSL